MKSLIKYAPNPLIPEIIKKIGPDTFRKLCLINEDISNKIHRSLGAKCGPMTTPPLYIPKSYFLFKYLFNDDTLAMYGTSHIKEVLQELDLQGWIKNLKKLEAASATRRREVLGELLERSKVMDKFFDPSTFEKYALNIWISKETYKKYYDLVMTISKNITKDNSDLLIRKFIKEVIQNDDYLVNWGLFPIMLNLKDPRIYHDEDIEVFIKEVVNSVRYEEAPSLNFPKDKDGLSRIIPKGTPFYKGYRTYRGALESTRDYAWYAFDVLSTLSYLVPPRKEDNKSYLSETVLFTDLYAYCSGVGGTAVFETTKELKLLDFGNSKTIKYMLQVLNKLNTPDDVIEAFKSGWSVVKDHVVRNSIDVFDGIVSKWLCENGYDGYISMGTLGLHDEVMLCNISENMRYVGDYDPRIYMNFHLCEEPYSWVDTSLIFW